MSLKDKLNRVNDEISRLYNKKRKIEQTLLVKEEESERKEIEELESKIKALDERGAKLILDKSHAEVAELRKAREAAEERYQELLLPKCSRCGYRGEDAYSCICYAR